MIPRSRVFLTQSESVGKYWICPIRGHEVVQVLFCHGNLEPWRCRDIYIWFLDHGVNSFLISFSLLMTDINLTLSISSPYKRLMIENFHDYNERSYNRRLISYFLLKENTRTRKNDQKKRWNKEHDTKTTQKNKEKSSPLRIGNDMAPIGLHDIMHPCPRFWQVNSAWQMYSCLVDFDFDFEIPAARLGFLFDCILYLFLSCFLTFLYLIQFRILYNSGSRTTVDGLGWNDESSLASIQTSCGLRYPFHCRLAYSHFLFCLFPWFFHIPTFSHSFETTTSTRGKRHPIRKQKKTKKKRPIPLITFLNSQFWLPITRFIFIFLCAPPPYHHATHPFFEFWSF